MSHPLLDKHRATLDGALNAIATRGYWSAYNEMPSPKVYGETAPDDGKKAFEAHLGQQFALDQPGQSGWHGGEQSPYGIDLNVQYPVCDIETLIGCRFVQGFAGFCFRRFYHQRFLYDEREVHCRRMDVVV